MTPASTLVEAGRWSLRVLVVVLLLGASGVAQTTEPASVDSSGSLGSGFSMAPAISEDGRYVAFYSYASNLVPGDTNGNPDAFVHDFQTGATERVSVDFFGTQVIGATYDSSISGDGRYVTFWSTANNLVPGDTNGATDIFVHDRQTGAIERVSISSAGNQGNSASSMPFISGDGRHVAFRSVANNLVSGDTNGVQDAFVHDRQTGTTERVSIDSSGNQANGANDDPVLSRDGRYVAFDSLATNLVPGDTNSSTDAFVYDRQTGVTERASIDSFGNEGNGASGGGYISFDGRYVLFGSSASNLVPGDTNGTTDTFVHDRQTGMTERISVDSSGNQSNNASYASSFSGDARYVAFWGFASNLVPGDTNGWPDVFVHDLQTGTTERVSVDSGGNEGNGKSSFPSISGNGRFVAFASEASNLIPADTNGAEDIFVRDRATSIEVYCTAGVSAAGCQALLSTSGTASATAPSGFTLSAATVEGQKDGLFFFGTNGQQANPWGNGTSFQCVVPPVTRGGSLSGSGTIGACDGSFAQDLNATWCSACPYPQKNPGVGTIVQAQLWYRDPLSTSNQTTSLSDAIEFGVGP